MEHDPQDIHRKQLLQGIYGPYAIPISDLTKEMSDELHERRDLLLAEIYNVFGSVTRVGGISWSEAFVIDGYGSDRDRELARLQDVEIGWQDLVEDESWRSANMSAWSFLDGIGFRYYLPAEMVRAVDSRKDEGISFYLTLRAGRFREHLLNKWSALDFQQSACIKRFLEFMVSVSSLVPTESHRFEVTLWAEALDSYWERF